MCVCVCVCYSAIITQHILKTGAIIAKTTVLLKHTSRTICNRTRENAGKTVIYHWKTLGRSSIFISVNHKSHNLFILNNTAMPDKVYLLKNE